MGLLPGPTPTPVLSPAGIDVAGSLAVNEGDCVDGETGMGGGAISVTRREDVEDNCRGL